MISSLLLLPGKNEKVNVWDQVKIIVVSGDGDFELEQPNGFKGLWIYSWEHCLSKSYQSPSSCWNVRILDKDFDEIGSVRC
jgi:hypothetical protein